jgi:16S rRNA (cytosine1402-N4)-methyltransferase
VNGLLADLGVSSHHFDTAERGFSTRYDGPLDMRMDPEASLDAARVLADYSFEALTRLFKDYGELRQGKKLARRVVERRERKALERTSELRELAEPLFPPDKRESSLAKVFQALRIEVNGELEALEDLLKSSPDLMEEGGRMVFLTYHSLEDRLVKRFIQHGNFSGEPVKDEKGHPIRPFRPVHKKPLTPSEEELDRNPRARSAKLRAAERIAS